MADAEAGVRQGSVKKDGGSVAFRRGVVRVSNLGFQGRAEVRWAIQIQSGLPGTGRRATLPPITLVRESRYFLISEWPSAKAKPAPKL